jgi:hypothetical protein
MCTKYVYVHFVQKKLSTQNFVMQCAAVIVIPVIYHFPVFVCVWFFRAFQSLQLFMWGICYLETSLCHPVWMYCWLWCINVARFCITLQMKGALCVNNCAYSQLSGQYRRLNLWRSNVPLQVRYWHCCAQADLNCTVVLPSVCFTHCFCYIGKAASVREAGVSVVLLRFVVCCHSDLKVPYSKDTIEKELYL